MNPAPETRIQVATWWPKEEYERIEREATELGLSFNDFVVDACAGRGRSNQGSAQEGRQFLRLIRQALHSQDFDHPIGHLRIDRLFLFPEESLRAARVQAATTEESFTGTSVSVGSSLRKLGLLRMSDKSPRAVRRIDGQLRRVWDLPADEFEPIEIRFVDKV